MKLSRSRRSRISTKIAILAAMTLAAGSASALNPNWNTAVDGNWNDTTKWSTAAIPVAGDFVTFNAAAQDGPETIYLNGNRAATSLTFANTGTTTLLGGVSGVPAINGLTLTGGITVNSGAGVVTIGDTAGSPTAKVDLTMNSGTQTITNNSSNTLVIANNIAITSAAYNVTGSVSIGSVSQAAAGTATWNNANALSIGSYTTANTSAVGLTVSGAGTLTITGNITQGSGQLTLRRDTNAGTLILQGTSNLTLAVQIVVGTIQTAVTTNAFGSTASINVGAAGILALRGDTSASFGNGVTPYNFSSSASGATINVNQVSAAAANTVLSLGNVAMSNSHQINTTGANVGLSLGAVTGGTGAGNKTFNNSISATQGLTLASYTETATVSNALVFSGAGNSNVTGAITQAAGGTLAVTYTGSASLTLNGANAYNGVTTLSNATGTLVLAGSNSGTGATTLTNGTLAIAGASVNPLASGTLTLNNGSLRVDNAGHIINNATTLNNNIPINGANGITFSGNVTQTNAADRILTNNLSSGTLTFSNNFFLSDSSGVGRTLILSGTGNTTFSGVVSNFNGAGTAGGLQIANSGTTTLSNVHTYTGNTSISSGTTIISGGASIGLGSPTISVSSANLRVNGSIVAGTGGTVNISGNGVLSGSGTINKAIAFTSTGGSISPGNSPGILSTVSETWTNGNSYVWELNDWTNSPVVGVNYDQIQMTGTLNIAALTAGAFPGQTFKIDINGLTAGNVIGAVPGFDNTVNRSWTIATFSSGLAGSFNANLFTLDTTNFAPNNPLAGNFSISQAGNSLVLTYTSTGLTPANIVANPVNGSTLAHNGTVTMTNTAVGGTVDPAVLSSINVTSGLPANGTWGQTGLSTADINGGGGNQIGTVTKTDASNVLNGAKIPGTLTYNAAGKTVAASAGQGAYSYTLSAVTSGHVSPIGAGTTFGTAQTAAVANGDKVAGLTSVEDNTSLQNTLTLLDSSAISGPTSVSVQWRHRSANETYPGTTPPLPPDISSLITDVATVDLGASAPSVYVVQMDYDPAGLGGFSESDSFAAGHLYLAHMTAQAFGSDTGHGGAEDNWKNATLDSGNPQINGFLRAYQASDLSVVGSWGVDSINHVAWAVLPGTTTGQFAVVPEPASIGLLAIGAAGLLMRRRR